MNRHRLKTLISDTDEVVEPTRDVLLAVSGALSGDRKRIRLLVAKTKGRIEKRLQRELRAVGRSKPAPAWKKTKIRGARLTPPERPAPVAPPGAVGARLTDGRKLRLVLDPAAARHRDMLALRRVSDANTRRAFEAITHNGRAIDRLAASQRELADRLAKLQSNGDLALLRGIVEGLAHLERRMGGIMRRQDKALGAQKRSVRKRFARQARALKAQTRTAQIQKLHGAVMSLQSAAYVTQGKPLAVNNLLLAANRLVGSFTPEIIEALGLSKPGETSPLDWLAPLGSLVATQIALGRRQHVRFVSGTVSDFTFSAPPVTVALFAMVNVVGPGGGYFGEKKLSLESYIAPAEWEAFKRRKDVPVTTVVLEPRRAFEAGIWSTGEVSGGILTVRISALRGSLVPPDAVVSWTVDTRKSDG